MNKKFATILAIAVLVIAGFWLFRGNISHIEDTNGAEDVSLQTITESNIVKMDTGSIGGPNISKSALTGDTVSFSSKKFTGVYEILYDNFLLPSDFVLNLTAYQITGGNFQLVVVHNEEVVATLEPGLFVEYRLEDVTGTVSLRIAGESAAFHFDMSQFDYDMHAHVE